MEKCKVIQLTYYIFENFNIEFVEENFLIYVNLLDLKEFMIKMDDFYQFTTEKLDTSLAFSSAVIESKNLCSFLNLSNDDKKVVRRLIGYLHETKEESKNV